MFWKLIKRELKQVFAEDRRRAAFLFCAALIYMVLFGILYMPGTVRYVPLAVCDEEQSSFSHSLVQQFSDSDSFRIVQYISSPEEMQSVLDQKTAYAVLDIPRDFSRKSKAGTGSTVLFMVNGSNIVISNAAASAMQDILSDFSDRTAARSAALATGIDEGTALRNASPVHLRLRVLNNPTQTYLLYFVIGLAMAAFQQGLFLSAGASVCWESREKEEAEQLDPDLLLLSKFLTYWVLAMISFWLVLFLFAKTFNLPNAVPYGRLMIVGGAFSFAAMTLAMAAASLFRTEVQFVRASVMYTVPAFILAGYTWPLDQMPMPAQILSGVFPIAWTANTIRTLFLSGSVPDFFVPTAALLVIGCISAAVCRMLFVRKMRRQQGSSLKKYNKDRRMA